MYETNNKKVCATIIGTYDFGKVCIASYWKSVYCANNNIGMVCGAFSST